jgi:hypothetical protein
MENRNIPCKERIDKELKERIEEFKEGLKSEDPIEWINESALALTKTWLYRLELSYGGPQDYFLFEYDPEAKQLVRITYHFLDWFDGAEREIKENSEEWKILEKVFWEMLMLD